MARSVQEITSFTGVSILIIIHNVINNKVFLYTAFDYSTHLNHCTAILSTGNAYFVTFIELQISTIQLKISPNRQYLEISAIDL